MHETQGFRVDVQGVGESVWSTNALTYPTREIAEENAKDLARRWMGMEAYRVVPADTPRNEAVNSEDRVPA